MGHPLQELANLSPASLSFLKALLQRDPELRPSAFQALALPFINEAGRATDLPLEGSVVQRLQRFSTYGHLKQVVLKMIVEEMQAQGDDARAPGMGPSSNQMGGLMVRREEAGACCIRHMDMATDWAFQSPAMHTMQQDAVCRVAWRAGKAALERQHECLAPPRYI